MLAAQVKPGIAPWRQENLQAGDWAQIVGPQLPAIETVTEATQLPGGSGYAPDSIKDISQFNWQIPEASDTLNALWIANHTSFLTAADFGGHDGTAGLFAYRIYVDGVVASQRPLAGYGGMIASAGSYTQCYLSGQINGLNTGASVSGPPAVVERCLIEGPSLEMFLGYPLASGNVPVTLVGLAGTTGVPFLISELGSNITLLEASTTYQVGQYLTNQNNTAIYEVIAQGETGSGTVNSEPWWEQWPGGTEPTPDLVFASLAGISWIGTVVNGNETVTIDSSFISGEISDLSIGQEIAGEGVPNGTTVTAISTASFTISAPASSSGSFPMSIVPPVITFTANTTAGSAVLSDVSPSSTFTDLITSGYTLTGSGLPTTNPVPYIVSNDGTSQITMSVPATATSTGVTITATQLGTFQDGPNGLTLAYIGRIFHQDGIQIESAGSVSIRNSKISGFDIDAIIIQSSEQTTGAPPCGPIQVTDCDLQAAGVWIYVDAQGEDPVYEDSVISGWYQRSTAGVWSATATYTSLGRPNFITITDNLFRDGLNTAAGPNFGDVIIAAWSDGGPGGVLNAWSSYLITNGATNSSLKTDYPIFVPDEATRQAGILAQGVNTVNGVNTGTPNYSVYEQRFQYGTFPGSCDARSWIVWTRNRDQRENPIYPMTNRAGQPGFDENGYYTGP